MIRCNSKKILFPVCVFVFASTGVYIFDRGYPQPGHFFLLAFVITLILNLRSLLWELPEKLLLVFIAYVLIVNAYFYQTVGEIDFLISSLHWIYNAIILLSLRQFFLARPELGRALPYALIIVLLITIGLALLGEGSDAYWRNRLVGTFNDPNQLSYWLLCALVGSFLIKSRPMWFSPYVSTGLVLFVFVIAMLAGSRSAMIATLVLMLANLWWITDVLRADQRLRLSSANVSIYLVVGAALLLLLLGLLYRFHTAVSVALDDLILRVAHTDYAEQLAIRGYTRLYEFPQYLLFGAGEGKDGRFTAGLFEIHSSLIAPLFYYGVIGFGLIYGFFYQLIKGRLRGWQLLAISAPFVYGLFTYGLRTPMFWIMLAVVYTQTCSHRMKSQRAVKVNP